MSEHAQRPILLAVDFSPDSEAAFLWAARLARSFDAPLVVLHVVHDPASAPGYYAKQDAAGHLIPMEESAKKMLEDFLAEMSAGSDAGQGVVTIPRTTSGLPANRILEVAADTDAQLIVMGSQGRTGLKSLLIGSKAERVAKLSTVPVTIVKRPVEE